MGRVACVAGMPRGAWGPQMIQPMQKLLGTWNIGFENVELYATTGPSGSWGTTVLGPKDGGRNRIYVDITTEWQFTLDTLLHEVLEFQLIKLGHSYTPGLNLSTSSADKLFVFTHIQFTEVCSRSAWFLNEAVPSLQECHHAHHHPPVHKPRRKRK